MEIEREGWCSVTFFGFGEGGRCGSRSLGHVWEYLVRETGICLVYLGIRLFCYLLLNLADIFA